MSEEYLGVGLALLILAQVGVSTWITERSRARMRRAWSPEEVAVAYNSGYRGVALVGVATIVVVLAAGATFAWCAR